MLTLLSPLSDISKSIIRYHADKSTKPVLRYCKWVKTYTNIFQYMKYLPLHNISYSGISHTVIFQFILMLTISRQWNNVLVYIQIFNNSVTIFLILIEIPIPYFPNYILKCCILYFSFQVAGFLRNSQNLKIVVFSNHVCSYFPRLYRDGLGLQKG